MEALKAEKSMVYSGRRRALPASSAVKLATQELLETVPRIWLVGSFLQGHVEQQRPAGSIGRTEAGGGVAEDVEAAGEGIVGSRDEELAGVKAVGFEDQVIEHPGGFLGDPVGGEEQAVVNASGGKEEIGDETGRQHHVRHHDELQRISRAADGAGPVGKQIAGIGHGGDGIIAAHRQELPVKPGEILPGPEVSRVMAL